MNTAGTLQRRVYSVMSPRAIGLALAAALAAALIAALAMRAGAVPVLATLAAIVAAAVMLVRPQAATVLTAFLLYVNFPAILTKQHGMPPAAAGAFIALLGFPLAHALVVRRDRLKADATLGLMLAFLAVVLLSSLGAVDSGIAMARVQQYVAEGLLLYWLLVNAVPDLRTLRGLFWAVLAAGSLVTVLCLYQEVTGSYQQEFGGLAYRNYDAERDVGGQAVPRRQTWDRAQGPVDEPNRFAQIMIVLVPLAGFLHRTARSRGLRLSAAALGALTLTGVALTLSRGAFVTLAVMAAAMVSLRWIRPWHVLAGLLALTAAASTVSPFFLDRLRSITAAGHLLAEDESRHQQADGAIRGRVTEMLAALHVFRDHPLLGVGPGQFSRYYFPRYSQEAGIKYRDLAVPRRAHSLYLELGAEYGVLGLGAFTAIVVHLMRGLWRARRHWSGKDREAADLSAALWLSLFAYLCTGIFLHLSYERYFWFLVAISSAALHVMRSRQTHPGRPDGRERVWLR